jgi:hypothetical protein
LRFDPTGILKALADLETHRPSGRNLEAFSGPQVAAAAGAALINLEATEADNLPEPPDDDTDPEAEPSEERRKTDRVAAGQIVADRRDVDRHTGECRDDRGQRWP